MKYFYLDKIYSADDGQFTADEKQALADEAQSALDALEEGDEGYDVAVLALASVNKIIACAPSGAVDITDYAEDIKAYSGSHTPSLVDGELVWTEKMITMTEEETLQARKVAYADTSTGSDALFIEYQALVAKGSDDAEAAKEAWLARREEIKLELPL